MVVDGVDMKTFLARAIDPPELTAIDAALATLEDLSAVATDGELTPLGRHMVLLEKYLPFSIS